MSFSKVYYEILLVYRFHEKYGQTSPVLLKQYLPFHYIFTTLTLTHIVITTLILTFVMLINAPPQSTAHYTSFPHLRPVEVIFHGLRSVIRSSGSLTGIYVVFHRHNPGRP